MRYFCVMVLLAWTVGSTEVSVADQRQSAGAVKGTEPAEQPLADIPKEFAFLFHSPEQFTRELAKRPTHFAYVEELWKGLPYDSISFERGGTAGCPPGVCSTVTFYRGTVSGIVTPASCLTGPCPPGDLRGRAELRTVTDAAVSNALAGVLAPAPRNNELEPFLEPFPQSAASRFAERVRLPFVFATSFLRNAERSCGRESEDSHRLWRGKTHRVVGDSAGVRLGIQEHPVDAKVKGSPPQMATFADVTTLGVGSTVPAQVRVVR